ncbi:KAP family P-loop NTPase fold protein [Marinomonas fungiae]|uniref:KAP family P-loop NTPase fold protein n=1 Tax=Marinomonas fungiae TaxID=1137284 RepID=UPI003A939CDF
MGLYKGQPDRASISRALDQLQQYFADLIDPLEISSETINLSIRADSTSSAKEDISYDLLIKATHRQSIHTHAPEDKLDRQQLINTLAAILLEPSNSGHQTIGLLGDWGVGKTSVVNLLKKQLLAKQAEQPFLFAEFNAWEYEHTDNLQAGIAQEMIKALSSPNPVPEPEEKSSFCRVLGRWVSTAILWRLRRVWITFRFAWRMQGWRLLSPILLLIIAILPFWLPESGKNALSNSLSHWGEWFKTLLPIAWIGGFLYPAIKQSKEVLAGPLAKELKTYLKLPDYGKHLGTIPIMREHISKLTQVRLNPVQVPFTQVRFGCQKRLLYVVDDLDRCGHKGIVKVLEAVRLVLDLEHVHVVIAVDQRIALAALAMHYKELETYHPTGDARQIARDYLAKIILLPIQLTKPDEATVSGYLESLWQHGATEEQSNNEPATIPNDNPINEAPSSESDDTEQETNGSSHTKENPNQVTSEPQQDNVKEENIAEVESDKKTDKPELEKEVKVIERLSEAQQNAFKHWAGHFELTNPRQLKRLYNGYNFLRNYYGEDTPQAPSAEQAESASKHHFPLLATLCALEYLNDLDDKPLRDALKSQLMGGAALASEEKEGQAIASKITKEIITLAGIKLGTQSGVIVVAYKAVEPFVLPALEATVSKK